MMMATNTLNVDFQTGTVAGPSVIENKRTIVDLASIFADQAAAAALDPSRTIYRVQSFQPVGDGTEGGLFWGATFIEPGQVGDEYFMTAGHFHTKRNRAEYYSTVLGQGALILMDEARSARVEWMTPGSTHYIPASTAHRVANVGRARLSFLACWPSDAGHDYEIIRLRGFSARVRCIHGQPVVVQER
jgi:glucose-6-phosphate isomerase, archaeal